MGKISFLILKCFLTFFFLYIFIDIIKNNFDNLYNPLSYLPVVIIILLLLNKVWIYKIIIAIIPFLAIFSGLIYLPVFLAYNEFHPTMNEVYLHVLKEFFYIILIVLYYFSQEEFKKIKIKINKNKSGDK